MARSYKRDSRGRFSGSSGGSSGRKGVKLAAPTRRTVGSKPQKRRGLLIQRASVAQSQRKLAAKNPADKSIKGTLSLRSQKGAVTRGKNKLAAAEQTGRIRLGQRAGVIGVSKGRKIREPATTQQPTIKAVRSAKASGTPRNKTGRKVDIQLKRAKAGGEFGPDGHWYPGGSFINPSTYVGGKSAEGGGANSSQGNRKKPGSGSEVTPIIRNRAPRPKPLTPPGAGISSQAGLNKTAQKLNHEFFGSNGYLNAGLEKSFRQAGANGRSPIANTRYIGALASRVSERELRSRTAAAIKRFNKEDRRYYIQSVQDARRNMPMTRFGVPKVGASDRQLLNAIRFDTAAVTIAGRRAMRGRRGGRNTNEEYAWVTNAMLSTSRRRK